MNKKQLTTYSVILGTILLIGVAIMAVKIDCPTDSQSKVFSIILALAGGAFSAVIPGLLNVGTKGLSAGGALAVFLVIFLWEPAKLEGTPSCHEQTISALVSFAGKPLGGTSVSLLETGENTDTDNSGRFRFTVATKNLDKDNTLLSIRLRKKEIGLDTTLSINARSATDQVLRLDIPKFCILCKHIDSEGNQVNRGYQCYAIEDARMGYQDGFTKRGRELGFETECVKE